MAIKKKVSLKKLLTQKIVPKKVIAKKAIPKKIEPKKPDVPIKKEIIELPKNDKLVKQWINEMRRKFRAGELDKTIVEALNQLPEWKWVDHSRFDKKCNLVKNFADRNGHCRVPKDHLENNQRISTWIIAQRVKYRRNALSEYEIKALESIKGWQWVISKPRPSFMEMLEMAKEYIQRNEV